MKNLFKKLFLTLVAGFALVGCGGKDPDPTPGPTPGPQAENIHENVDLTDEALKSIGAGKKLYVTTLGQAEYTLCQDLVTEVTEDFTESNQLKAADVEDGAIVVLVIGYTGKGIAGNITKASEIERVDGFKEAAEQEKFQIISLFLGGKQRRGENTDSFLGKILPVSEVGFVWDDGSGEGGNYDGKVAEFAGETHCYVYADELDIVPGLEWILK